MSFAFCPTVPAHVVVVAVPISFIVGFVVFVVVGYQIVEGEPVVARYEIDAV